MRRCFLSGIGGSGMSALAQILQSRGWAVAGSDRSHDRAETPEKFSRLQAAGIVLAPQDGSGLRAGTDCLIVSSAVEEDTPDVQAARRLGISVRKRAEVLAEMFNMSPVSIGVAGTSGKSTITAMAGWILQAADMSPTIVNGAAMRNFTSPDYLGNAVAGKADIFVAEIDESDGSIALFHPAIAVVSNITVDHKPIEILRDLFSAFGRQTKNTLVLNLDDAESVGMMPEITPASIKTFSLSDRGADFYASDIVPDGYGVAFIMQALGEKIPVELAVPGRHNVANALAATAAAVAAGVEITAAAQALSQFAGISRRFEIVGEARGVTVIDDFAHNPEKIAATLQTLHEQPGRVLAVFQSHGFGPTKLMRAALVKMFARELHAGDMLVMPEIYYAGGTASRDISAADIIADIRQTGEKSAHFIPARGEIIKFLTANAKEGDRIVIMGARDDTLPSFARNILSALCNS